MHPGSGNSAAGYQALTAYTTGSYNTAIGDSALGKNTTGTYNTAVGMNSGTSTGALTNTTSIGYGTKVAASNHIIIGNPSVTIIGGYPGWSILSDSRFKNNVHPEQHGLDFIMKLNPVVYHLDIHKLNAFMGLATNDEEAAKEKEAMSYTGFLAQEVDQG